MAPPAARAPSVVLGAGYAGLALWQSAHRRARGRWPIRIIDRHPTHVVRTELYQVGRIAAQEGAVSHWALPLSQLLDREPEALTTATVTGIDPVAREVHLDDGVVVPYAELAICLGSAPAYHGVPGAEANTFSIYRLSGAQKLAQALVEQLGRRSGTAAPLRVVVVGGGSTGTEVAAEIATVRWARIVGRPVPPVEVTLLAGRFPLLAGLPEGLIRHARDLLSRAGVGLDEGRDVARVRRGSLTLTDGTEVPFDLAIWAAGIQPPDLIRALPVPHGRGGRLRVGPTLEVEGHPGLFALGDVADVPGEEPGSSVPATAQAALAEAPVAGENLVARRLGRPLTPFRYREWGFVVKLGLGEASGSVQGLSVWGPLAAALKGFAERGHRLRARAGGRPPGL